MTMKLAKRSKPPRRRRAAAREYTERDIPTAAQVLAAVEVLGDAQHRRYPRNRVKQIVLAMLAATGLRAGELAMLNVGSVKADLERPTVFVPGSIVKRRPGSEGQSRTVSLSWSPALLPIIQAWAKQRREMGAGKRDAFVCSLDAGREGKRLDRKQVNLYAQAAMRAGKWWREGFTAHTMRHWFASYACGNPHLGMVRARKALGHRSLEVTTRYAHELPDAGGNVDIFGKQ